MHTSILVIGATGMLVEATAQLAERCELLTFTGRRSQSISRMNSVLDDAAARCIGLTLDWNDERKFMDQLMAHCDVYGYPSLTIAWLHNDSLGPKIAASFAQQIAPTTFYQVRGSAAAKPGTDASTASEQFSKDAAGDQGLAFHQIVLGFKLDESGSRWLSNSEISAGVIAAIDNRDSISVVGVVDPWALRP